MIICCSCSVIRGDIGHEFIFIVVGTLGWLRVWGQLNSFQGDLSGVLRLGLRLAGGGIRVK